MPPGPKRTRLTRTASASTIYALQLKRRRDEPFFFPWYRSPYGWRVLDFVFTPVQRRLPGSRPRVAGGGFLPACTNDTYVPSDPLHVLIPWRSSRLESEARHRPSDGLLRRDRDRTIQEEVLKYRFASTKHQGNGQSRFDIASEHFVGQVTHILGQHTIFTN